MKEYYVYILTNSAKTVLYIGVTNDLSKRQRQHFDAHGSIDSFTGKYRAYYLIYYETYTDIREAITREKQLKGWKRSKKIDLITKQNPQWQFLSKDNA